MGLIRTFNLMHSKSDGTSYKIEFMIRNGDELWMLPQNATWPELQSTYIEAKKLLREGKIFEEP